VDQGDIAFHGRIAGHDGTGWVYLARGRAVKATFSIRTDPAQVLGTYDRLRSALVRQYGQTSHGAELFEAPFAQGDGRALEALGAGKGMIATAWREEESDPNVGLVLMIGRDLAVKLSFEGPEWHAEAQRRTRAGS
jgi:hypothetical protein